MLSNLMQKKTRCDIFTQKREKLANASKNSKDFHLTRFALRFTASSYSGIFKKKIRGQMGSIWLNEIKNSDFLPKELRIQCCLFRCRHYRLSRLSAFRRHQYFKRITFHEHKKINAVVFFLIWIPASCFAKSVTLDLSGNGFPNFFPHLLEGNGECLTLYFTCWIAAFLFRQCATPRLVIYNHVVWTYKSK